MCVWGGGVAAAPYLATAPPTLCLRQAAGSPSPPRPIPPAEALRRNNALGPRARTIEGGATLPPSSPRMRSPSLTPAVAAAPTYRAFSGQSGRRRHGTVIGSIPPIAFKRFFPHPAPPAVFHSTPSPFLAPGTLGKIWAVVRKTRALPRRRLVSALRWPSCAGAAPGGQRAGGEGKGGRRSARARGRPRLPSRAGRRASLGRRRRRRKEGGKVVVRAGPRRESPPGGGERGAARGSCWGREVSPGVPAGVGQGRVPGGAGGEEAAPSLGGGQAAVVPS